MVAVTPAGNAPGLGAARAVADAVLYEGYLLYPYRRSSGKNLVRWQFGLLFPPAWAAAHGLDDVSVAGSAESWWQQTECLAEAGPAAEIEVCVRFLQVQRRTVARRRPGGGYQPVGELTVGGRAELSFEEAVGREFVLRFRLADLLAAEQRVELRAPGGKDISPLADGGRPVGRVVRQRLPVTATATVSAAACEGRAGLLRLRVRVENTGRVRERAPRPEALRSSLIACHALLAVRGGSFVSLLDPPQTAAAAARSCVNVHTFPVLAGPPGDRQLMLSSPILLYDHPRIAPESPGDLHDAAEIDEILSLRALTLTEAEKREARATDRRAASILDRIDTMPAGVFARLHGAVRSLRPVAPSAAGGPGGDGVGMDGPAGDGRGGGNEPGGGGRPDVPWWDPGADASVSPETGSVLVAGVRLARGSRVRLRPHRRGTDPQDMFLDGRCARVEAVLVDVDGSRQLAVTLDDDPGADLNRWYGRYRYFRPDEVEPLPAAGGSG